MTNALIANFQIADFDHAFDPAFLDDNWQDRKDALDCECVPFDDAIDAEIAEAIYEADLVGAGHYMPGEIDLAAVPVGMLKEAVEAFERDIWDWS